MRLLIFGGEACPPELAARLVGDGREVWNTYGPTEATVVACAALLTGEGPVRIGHALDGWDLAVVGPDGRRSRRAASGELIIGGVGLARYLDPVEGRREVRGRRRARLGRGRTAAATWSGTRPTGCCSSGGPTTRSRSAAGGSSWARSTPRCSACRAWPARRRRSDGRPPARRCSSGTWCRSRASSWTWPSPRRLLTAQPARGPGPAARAGRRDPDARLGQGRPRRAALAARAARRGVRAGRRAHADRRVGGRAVDRRARRRGGGPRTRTSSRPAAAAWSPRSWSARCASGSPR